MDEGLRVRFSENEAKGNPWIEGLWGERSPKSKYEASHRFCLMAGFLWA